MGSKEQQNARGNMNWLAPLLLLHWARRTIGEGVSAVQAAHGSYMLKLVSAVEAMLNSSVGMMGIHALPA